MLINPYCHNYLSKKAQNPHKHLCHFEAFREHKLAILFVWTWKNPKKKDSNWNVLREDVINLYGCQAVLLKKVRAKNAFLAFLKSVWKWMSLYKWPLYDLFWPFFCHMCVYLSKNWGPEGHFEVLNGSKSWLGPKFWP